MTPGHEDRIGELAKLIDSEKSPEKVLALAEELARILAAEPTTDKTPTKPTPRRALNSTPYDQASPE